MRVGSILSLLAVSAILLSAGCQTTPPPARGAPAEAVPLHSLTSTNFSDLAPLRQRLDGVRIVQLGESSHGAAEYNQIKTRLVRFLHEEMGFDVLAFESDPYQCALANQTAGEASAVATLTSCVVGVWHTEEVRELFEYIRATRTTDRPLILAGYDIQPIGPNKQGRPDYLAQVVATVDPAYAEEVRALDQRFLTAYGSGRRAGRAYFNEHRSELIDGYVALNTFLRERESLLVQAFATNADPLAPLMAQQISYSMAQYLRQQTAETTLEYMELRDQGMAENLIYLAETLRPGARVIAWAHNAHIQYNNQTIDLTGVDEPEISSRSAGWWLRERYGDDLYTIGLYASAGRMARNDREVITVTPVLPNSLEAQAIPAGAPGMLFLAPTDGSRDPLWHQPTSAKYWGAADLPMILSEQYDAVVLLRETTPPRYLSVN